MPSPLFNDLNKFANTQALPLKPLNILVVVFVNLGALSRVYTNDKVQDIIQVVIEAKPAVVKSSYKHSHKTRFFDVYRGDNYVAYYNFY